MITTSSMLRFDGCKRWRIIAAGLLAAALAGLSGCSTLRLAYSQADELGYWWLDGHFGFEAAQRPQVRAALARWFAWHRASELPEYARLLEQAAAAAPGEITPEQACDWYGSARARLHLAVERALPEAAPLAAGLGPEQLGQLERKQAKTDRKFRDDFLQADRDARREGAVERATKRAEQLYGRLAAAQRAVVAQGVADSPLEPERWLAERQRRQGDLLQTLTAVQHSRAGADAAHDALRAYWSRAAQAPQTGERAEQQALDAYNCRWTAAVHNATTPEQRLEAQRRLRGWAADLRALAAQPA